VGEDLPVQAFAEFFGCHIEIVLRLEPEPELGGGVEISGVRLSTTYHG